MDYLNKIVKHGHFTLKSGTKTTIYFDFRSIISNPNILIEFTNQILNYINDQDLIVDYVCGVPSGAIPLASFVSCRGKIPLLMVRDKVKKYGNHKSVEGDYKIGGNVLLIEDTVTTGSSLMECVNTLRKSGLVVKKCICLINRSGVNYPLIHSLIDIGVLYQKNLIGPFDQVTPKVSPLITKLREKIQKCGRVCISLDLECIKDIIDWIDRYGEMVCAVKIHSDMLSKQISKSQISRLERVLHDKDLLLIEDRKFGDIGHITQYQYTCLPIKPDIVTVHAVAGESTIQGLIEADMYVSILLVMDMTTHQNLINDDYSQKVYQMGLKYRSNVIGFVSSNPPPDLTFVNFTTGISLDYRQDSLGQRYRTPSSTTAEVMIVGRSILNSNNITETIKKYNTTN